MLFQRYSKDTTWELLARLKSSPSPQPLFLNWPSFIVYPFYILWIAENLIVYIAVRGSLLLRFFRAHLAQFFFLWRNGFPKRTLCWSSDWLSRISNNSRMFFASNPNHSLDSRSEMLATVSITFIHIRPARDTQISGVVWGLASPFPSQQPQRSSHSNQSVLIVVVCATSHSMLSGTPFDYDRCSCIHTFQKLSKQPSTYPNLRSDAARPRS